MKTVNSLSGGKTSSYLVVHYPADHEVFSLVTIDDERCSPKDKELIKKVSDKIGKQFIATAESDLTLKLMFDLEQMIGREINWVAGKSFDEVIAKKKHLPSSIARFCTKELKLQPIFDWWFLNIGELCEMRIGFRYDEVERAARFTTDYEMPVSCNNFGRRNQRWENIEWRVGSFPLIDNKINHWHIKDFWRNKNIVFPEDSNCLGCFWKPTYQLSKNFRDEPDKLNWFSEQEKKRKATFKNGITYAEIKKLPIQDDLFYGTGAGCQAGECTN